MSKTSDAPENKFECKCLKKHESLEQLQKHIREDHTAVKGLSHCTTCQKTYRNRQDLTRHVANAHRKIKNNECPICRKKFAFRISRHY